MRSTPLAAFLTTAALGYFAYIKSKQAKPGRFKQAWLGCVQNKVYPFLLKTIVSCIRKTDFVVIVQQNDMLHVFFLWACKLDLLPLGTVIDT